MIPYLTVLIIFLGAPVVMLARALRPYLWIGFYLRLTGIGFPILAYALLIDNLAYAARLAYSNPTLVIGLALLYLPVERYFAFGLHILFVCLLTVGVWRWAYPNDFGSSDEGDQFE
ncbi:MAG TPA: hypothetical protein PLD47_10565 [Aggregatilineales bacterium]|nr:hypothetical protein [Anaerolineales bacterium]HRE48157.1 hypothetical protein [Aggregatilineales bacterium]